MLAQLLRFAGVGGLVTVVHVVVAVLVEAAFPVSAQAANLAGYGAAVLLSFIGHARITFAVAAPTTHHFLRFLVMSALGLATSSATVWLFTTQLGFSFGVAMVAVAILVPAASFLAMRFWVFAQA